MTKIEWTDETWNPTRGCSMAPGSELGGCLNCYAARNQLRRPSQTGASGKPFAILRESGPRWSGEVELVELKVSEPLHWKTPRRIFVDSMSDLWHETLDRLKEIAFVYSAMYRYDWHTYQVLTKRPANRLETFADPIFWEAVSQFAGRPCIPGAPHIWEGVSVEDQLTADARIPLLLQTPAALRFVSYEPALGPVDFTQILYRPDATKRLNTLDHKGWTGLDWGIVGGESGPQARPCDLEWILATVDQFATAGVPLFVKQIGSKPVRWAPECLQTRYPITNSKGGNRDEWPERIRVREFPR